MHLTIGGRAALSVVVYAVVCAALVVAIVVLGHGAPTFIYQGF